MYDMIRFISILIVGASATIQPLIYIYIAGSSETAYFDTMQLALFAAWERQT